MLLFVCWLVLVFFFFWLTKFICFMQSLLFKARQHLSVFCSSFWTWIITAIHRAVLLLGQYNLWFPSLALHQHLLWKELLKPPCQYRPCREGSVKEYFSVRPPVCGLPLPIALWFWERGLWQNSDCCEYPLKIVHFSKGFPIHNFLWSSFFYTGRGMENWIFSHFMSHKREPTRKVECINMIYRSLAMQWWSLTVSWLQA